MADPKSTVVSIDTSFLDGRRIIYATITCKNGHTEKRLYDNIIRHHGCKSCAKKQHRFVFALHFQKYTIEYVDSILKDHKNVWLNRDEYVNAGNVIEYQCVNCRHIARSNITNILNGRMFCGCSPYKRKTSEEFSYIASIIDDRHELLSEYKNCKEKVTIRRTSCGHIFDMTPDSFIGGNRFPHCMSSHGEMEIKRCIDNAGISYIQQYRFDDCRNIKPLPFDFCLPEFTACIEYNGHQHYCPADYFVGDGVYRYLQRNDEIKRSCCIDNVIYLVIIPYWEFENIGGVIDALVSKAR